jgi:hypothetical protein
MQITFDTNNARDLAILEAFISTAMNNVQPTVTQNGGTTATGSTLSPEGSGVDESAAPAVAPVTEKKPRAKKPVATQEEAAPVEPTPSTSAPAQTADAKPLSLDEVRAALQQFTASKGVPAGIELLKKYNAGRISELAEENFAAFAAECAV